MVYPRFFRVPVFPEAFVPSIVIHGETGPVPVVAFDPEVIIRVYSQFWGPASGFQHPLSQFDTGGDTRAIHFFYGDTFIFFDERFATVIRGTTYVDTYKTQK